MTASNIETLCVAAQGPRASVSRPLATPLVTASVFETGSIEQLDAISRGEVEGFVYARGAHPNADSLEQLLSRLEGAESALACASGMGAVTCALMSILPRGGRLLADLGLYGRTIELIMNQLADQGSTFMFGDLCDTSEAERLLSQPTTAVLIESISNPMLRVPDLPALAGLAHEAGALLVVDNTAASPYHCRPLMHGADLVLHSGAKYLAGHSDAMSGAVVGPASIVARARTLMTTLGCPASPFDCWLTERGIKTLALRMATSSANAERVAGFLAGCEGVVRSVIYPGLSSHPQHERSARLLDRGAGALIGVELCGGASAAAAFVKGLRHIRFAASFGDVSTTVAYPAAMGEQQSQPSAGVAVPPPGLLRLSIGIEHQADIIQDLERGLAAATAMSGGGD